MTKTKDKDPLDSLVDPLTIAIASGSNSGGGGFPPELIALIQRKLMREMKEQEDKEQELRRLLEARSEAFQEEIKNRKYTQEVCPHRKEDGRPRIGGQRLSDGTVLFFCQFCHHPWLGSNLPLALQISLDYIGG